MLGRGGSVESARYGTGRAWAASVCLLLLNLLTTTAPYSVITFGFVLYQRPLLLDLATQVIGDGEDSGVYSKYFVFYVWLMG